MPDVNLGISSFCSDKKRRSKWKGYLDPVAHDGISREDFSEYSETKTIFENVDQILLSRPETLKESLQRNMDSRVRAASTRQ